MTTIASAHEPGQPVAKQRPEHLDVVVIGAGQAGLAAGYYLAQRGLRFAILESCPRVGDSWRNRWDSLRLFTPAKYNGLPGLPFPLARNIYPTKDEMADYLVEYASVMGLPVRTATTARHVTRSPEDTNAWLVETDDTIIATDSVVIATGGYQLPKVPRFASELDPGIHQIHSHDYRNPAQFQTGGVLVVGASNSGAEIALEAARHQHTTWLAGRDPGHIPINWDSPVGRLAESALWFMVNKVLTVNTPMGRKAMGQVRNHGLPVERISRSDLKDAGVTRILSRVVGAKDGKPRLADDRVLAVDNIVWCTGFRGDYTWIDGITYGEDGYPEQDRGVVTNAPGLYFMGLRFQRAASSSLVGGAGRDAAHVVGHIAARIRQAA